MHPLKRPGPRTGPVPGNSLPWLRARRDSTAPSGFPRGSPPATHSKGDPLTLKAETPDRPLRLSPFLVDAPNLATLSGLAAGFGALGLAVQERFGPALCLALLAILIDQLDGRLARNRPERSPAVRAFGAHLDCYVDFVSKGVFPALMLVILGDFAWWNWLVGGLHLAAIAVRYSYEFVPSAPRRGLSPDYSILVFGLLYLASPGWGDHYPRALAAAMVGLAALNLAPFSVPKLKGLGMGAFIACSLGLMALLIGRP